MAEAHHDEHGNTPAAWFLTISWVVIWTVGAAAVILGSSLVLWTFITLGASAAAAAVAGLMKRAGMGRRTPRTWVEAPQEAAPDPVQAEPRTEVKV